MIRSGASACVAVVAAALMFVTARARDVAHREHSGLPARVRCTSDAECRLSHAVCQSGVCSAR